MCTAPLVRSLVFKFYYKVKINTLDPGNSRKVAFSFPFPGNGKLAFPWKHYPAAAAGGRREIISL
jgi:hypothetical protein